MPEFFRVTDARGTDIREILGDVRGHYLGDRAQTAAQGTIWEVTGQIDARLKQSDVNAVLAHRITDDRGNGAGVDAATGEICSSGVLKTVAGQASGTDVTVALTDAEEQALYAADSNVRITAIITRDNSTLFASHCVFEISGTQYAVVDVDGLQGQQNKTLRKGDTCTLEIEP